MIGWTKTRKRCPKHGLVLRKDPDSSYRADYCPACGERLAVVSVPYLFQVYFHPALMTVLGCLAFSAGLLFFLDVRGCVQEDRRVAAVAITNMPNEWKTLHAGMDSSSSTSSRWSILSNYLAGKSEKMPYLDSNQLRMFLDMLAPSRDDDAFDLITAAMERPE